MISFDSRSNRSQHMLQDNTSNASLQIKSHGSYDDDQSANPMIQQQYNRTNNLNVKKKEV